MSSKKHGNQDEGAKDNSSNNNPGNDNNNYLKSARHNWLIWVGVVLMLLAMLVFLMRSTFV